MTFSIIIANYNSEDTIRKCLDSILNQTFKDFEIMIVDDMSTDNSVNIIKEYKDERIKLIELRQKAYNGGARNIGFYSSVGEYILFLDCDDWLYSKDSLKAIKEVIDWNKADLIRLPYVAHKNGGEGKIMLKESTLEQMAHTVFVAPWTKAIKRDKFVDFPENTLLEDVVQHIEQIDNISSIAICKTPYAVWNRDNKNAISSDTAKYDENSKRYSSVYRNYADLIDLRCKHSYCEEERQKRIATYKDIILRDDVLGLINGGESQ
jgi:glycosyltransferase involved in cell wall biosynthesis